MPIPTRFLLLPVALLQLLTAYVPTALGWGEPIGTRATADGIPPELPPGLFFAIWGPIFLAYVVIAIYALAKDTELVRRLAFPLVISGLLTAIWMVSSQVIGNPLMDFVLLIPVFCATWLAAYRFDTMRGLGGSVIKWTADILTGLLAGWLTVATAISVPRAGRYLLGQGPTDSEWISLWSVIATISVATYVFKRRISRSAWYYWAAAWGLLGIIVNNWTRTGFGYFGWITLFFGIWLIQRRLTRGANGAMAQT